MTIVVDASVVIKWFVEEPFCAEARRLTAAREVPHAPELLAAEVANIAWKKWLRREITPVQRACIADEIARGIPQLHQMGQLAVRALDLAAILKHPAYDCFYLACAEMLDVTLITADQRLLRVAHAAGITRVQPLASVQ